MAKDDWRLRIELGEGRSYPLLERLGLVHDEADELARELKDARLAVTHDSDTVFVYAASSLELEKAKAIVQRELEELNTTADALITEHWLVDEDRWDDEPPADWDDQVVREGYAPWEVRFTAPDHAAAERLADQLASEGYGIVRRSNHVIAGTASEAEARALAERLHGEAEPGGELVWQAMEGRPFSIISPF
jgi:hypothetical protein